MFQYDKKCVIELMTINVISIVPHRGTHFKNIFKDLKILNSTNELKRMKCHIDKCGGLKHYATCLIQTTPRIGSDSGTRSEGVGGCQ